MRHHRSAPPARTRGPARARSTAVDERPATQRALARLAFAAALFCAGTAGAADHVALELKNADGEVVGQATLTALPAGGVLIDARLDGLEPGPHAFHLHETGDCDASSGFKSAGGHIAGDREHGFLVGGGPHPGDMPNIHVPDSGALQVEVVNARVALAGDDGDGDGAPLLDTDGSALLIHAGADDYTTQSAGDAGERVACAEILPGS